MKKILFVAFALMILLSLLPTSSAQTTAPVIKMTQGDSKQERHERRHQRRVHHKRRHHHRHHKHSA
jgi:hypothetical protein